MYNSTNLDIEIHMNANGKTVSLPLGVPDFAVETKAFLDALEFEEPVDGRQRCAEVLRRLRRACHPRR